MSLYDWQLPRPRVVFLTLWRVGEREEREEREERGEERENE
jgi:hypothetical protein